MENSSAAAVAVAVPPKSVDLLVSVFRPGSPLHDGAVVLQSNRLAAAQKALAYLNNGQSPQALIAEARRLVFLKGYDSHDYKFSSAVLEDYYQVSSRWRNRFLATSLFKLHGSGERTNPLVDRISNAFQA